MELKSSAFSLVQINMSKIEVMTDITILTRSQNIYSSREASHNKKIQ